MKADRFLRTSVDDGALPTDDRPTKSHKPACSGGENGKIDMVAAVAPPESEPSTKGPGTRGNDAHTISSPGSNDESLHAEVARLCHCSPDDVEDVYACTALQEGMMALTFRDSTAYTVEYKYNLPLDIDLERLQDAWNQAARANPILRTRIVSTARNGCVQAVIRGPLGWQVKSVGEDEVPGVTDLVSWKAGEPLASFTFDLGERDLTVVLHHSICDDWSMALLLRETDKAYHGGMLTERPFRPLVDYVHSTRTQAEAFWREKFEDTGELAIYPPPPSVGYSPHPGHRCDRTWAINPVGGDAFTLNTKIRLAWAILQSRYTNSSDVLFGAVNVGRGVPVAGIQEVSGPALTTTPVRVRLRGQDTVAEALGAIQQEWASGMQYEHVGLQRLLHLGPRTAAACQFQTLLSVEPRDGHSVPRLFAQSHAIQRNHDLYSLVLRCRPSPRSMCIEAWFDPAVIERAQVNRILGQLAHIYGQIEQCPTRQLTGIEAVSPEDRHELQLWNNSASLMVPATCVHTLVEQQCRSQGQALAVHSWDGDLSYDSLIDMSSALALHLAGKGVREGVFVPLYLSKSKWTAVAMLAVMKAGGAFVLLDPSYPLPRLQEMRETIQATVLLTCGELSSKALNLGFSTTVQVDDVDLETRATGHSTLPGVSPASPVYATFTSGSTGKPKGVVVRHSGYAASALAHGPLYNFRPQARVLQFASPAFDSCIIEHLTPLIIGGTVCIPTPADCHSNLPATLVRFHINIACLTPSVSRIIPPESVPSLDTLAFVGEPVQASDIARWAPHAQVRNAYGPAECSAVFSVQPNLQKNDPANIGFPTGGVGWVVHPEDPNQLMPLGSTGELMIEGPIVGAGYISNPIQTAQVLVGAPPWRGKFEPVPRTQFYKTGDLVQCAADGSFRYIGRKDTQVKLHGQRLELAEIEHHLQHAFSAVDQVAVEMIRSDPKSPSAQGRPDAVLVGFVVVDTSTAPEAHDSLVCSPSADFRVASVAASARLSDSLPAFMVPSVLLPVHRIPLTASGKTDRRRLRDEAASLSWENMQSYGAEATVAAQPQQPTGDLEEKLRDIWAQTLNRSPDQVGVTESFFRLGGDSVSAMQAATGCQAAGWNVTVADIFRCPSVRKMADRIQEVGHSSPFTANVQEDPVDASFDLSPIQQVFFQHVPNGHNRFTQQFLLRLSRSIAASKIRRATETVVARHSMLRARFVCREQQWEQFVTSDADKSKSVVFREHWIPCCEDQEALKAILCGSQSLLDITRGPLLAVDLIHPEEGPDLLGFMAHHLVVDLVSWRVLLQDFEDILSSGRAIQPPSLSFQQWCRMQREYALEHLDPRQTLPTAVPTAPLEYWGSETMQNDWSQVTQQTVSLSRTTTQAIMGSANDALSTTPMELLLAALLHSFADAFPDRAVPTVYTEGHGREPWDPHINISRTVGWFTTLTPLVVDIHQSLEIMETVQRTKDARRAIAGNGWPYFAARHCHPQPEERMSDPVEILFNYTGLFQQLERAGALLQLAGAPDHDMVPMPPDLPRFALIDVSATVINKALTFTFMFHRGMKHQERFCRWIHECRDILEALPELLHQQEQRLTVSDLPLLRFDTDQHLQAVLRETAHRCHMRIADIANMYPCTPVQLGMWLAHLKAPDSYWSRIRWTLLPPRDSQSPLNMDKAQRAWQQIVSRHPILRTVLVGGLAGYEQPIQVVRKSALADIRIISQDSTNIDSYPNTPGAPSHSLLLQPQPDGRILCQLTIHHTLMDGVTREMILADFCDAYNDVLDDTPGAPYAAYVEYLSQNRRAGASPYWMDYLREINPCMFPSLPSLEKRHGAPTLSDTEVNLGPTDTLISFCRQQDITISSLLQVAWGIVLRAYTGSDEVCFGYLTSGRDIGLPQASTIAGPLINLLVCRLSLNADTAIQSVLQNTQADLAHGIQNQHWSMAHTMSSLGLSSQPLFDTALSLQKATAERSMEHKTGATLVSGGGHDATEYKITVNIDIETDKVHGNLTYWSGTFGPEQMDLIADTFQKAVDELMKPAHQILDDLETLGSKNESRILDWNRLIPGPVSMCIHSAIYGQAVAGPNAEAVSSWDGELTYSELEGIASSWAEILGEAGVTAEVFVPICCRKSKWTVVAVLAVLKAGGAFILLDPSHPAERLQEMIQQNFICPLMLTSAEYKTVAETIVPHTLVIEDLIHQQIPEPTLVTTQSHLASPSSSAYAIFTSGTTGHPKASVITHQSFSSAATAHSHALQLNQHSRVLQFASFAFDASIVEILTTMLVGGCVCMPSQGERDTSLEEAIQKYAVNWTLLTPSVARILNPKQVPTLGTLVMGGERMTASDLQQWSPFVDLMNAYGPSECSVIATAQTSCNALSLDTANIGTAMGCVTWLVSPGGANQAVPVGAPGELLIEGPIVGRGYVNRPGQMQESFLKSPPWLRRLRHSELPQVYWTGDLARYLPDGSLEYIGRKDRQVKLHGQRIELSGVEQHVLNCFPGHCDEVFADIIAPDASGPEYLVAAVVGEPSDPGNDDFEIVIQETRRRLKDEVPAFLIPHSFLPLPDVPRLVNGKVDRARIRLEGVKALQDQLQNAYRSEQTWNPEDLTLEERLLQDLWRQALHVPAEAVGPQDNFFQLGGDSIAAMKLASATHTSGFDLTVSDIFLRPQLCDMAELLSSGNEAQDEPAVLPMSLIPDDHRTEAREYAVTQCGIRDEDIEDIFPCTALQSGLIVLTAETPSAYVSHHCLQLSKGVDLDRLRAAWGHVADSDPILRTRIVDAAELGCLQVVVRNEQFSWTERDGDSDTEAIGDGLPFGKPLIHFQSSNTAPADLRVTMHHAVYDAWSLPLLLQKVQRAYHGESSTNTHSVPFQDFIQYALSQKENALEYWTTEFEDLEMDSFPPLPTPSFRPRALKEEQRTLQPPKFPYSVTRSTAVGLAWALVQSQYQGKPDVVFGVVSTGRTAPVKGVQTMTAPTIATVPLRVVVDPQTTVNETLEALQKKFVHMAPFEQVGLPAIAASGTNAARACAFQTLLNVEGREEVERVVAGLEVMTPVETTFANGAFNTYALQLTVSLRAQQIAIRAAFDDGVVPDAQIRRMLDQFAHVITQVYTQPDATLQDIMTVNPHDMEQLQAWNADIPPGIPAMVTDLIDQHCTSQPLAPAICSWDGEFSYQELDLLSSALANVLEGCGVGPGVFVPIYAGRSRWVAVAVLATLRVGAAFVLLDVSHPVGRLQTICHEIRAPLILAAESRQQIARTFVNEVVVIAKGNVAAYPALKQRRRSLCSDPQQALYAVFTSGSTGTPKGAILENGAFVTMVMPYSKIGGISPRSRVLHIASYAFDVSVLEILGTLCLGACVCIPSEVARREGMADAVQTLQPSHTILTPSLLRAFTAADLGPVQTVMLIGESVRDSDVAEWSGRVRLMNTYGPAECTVIFTIQPTVRPQDAANIGYPISGATWVTDTADPNRPVPIGAVGELLLEGPLVGRGYLNNIEQTEAAFIPCPPWLASFRSNNRQTCGTVYRTGDLVRYEGNGSLHFLGRKDSQVKLRGQRFELGEVEKQVQEAFQDALCDIVALIVTPAATIRTPCLTVFVVPRDMATTPACEHSPIPSLEVIEPPGFAIVSSKAQQRLEDALPSYMLPSSIIPLRRMPRTIGGKLDRRQLCDAVAAVSHRDLAAYAATAIQKRAVETDAERTLQRIWARALGLPLNEVGAEDSFFRLGGDSISAFQATTQARAAGIEHSVSDLFQWRTIVQVARRFAPDSQNGLRSLPNIESILPCTPAQRGILLSQMKDNTSYTPHFIWKVERQSPSDLDGDPTIDLQTLVGAWHQVVSRHPALRTAFQQDLDNDGQFEQVIVKEINPRVNLIQGVPDLDSVGDTPNVLTRLSAKVSQLDGETLPHQLTLCSTSTGEVYARLDISHVIMDAMSIRVLETDLCYAYDAPLAPGSQSDAYKKYVTLSQEQSSGPARDYWRTHLQDVEPCKLPSEPCQTDSREVDDLKQLDVALTNSGSEIEDFCRGRDWTASNLLYFAWALTLQAFTGSDDVCFGTLTSGRMVPVEGIDGAIGQFSNMSVCRIRMSGGVQVDDVALGLQEDFSNVLSYQAFPLIEIARAAGVPMEELTSTAINVQYEPPCDQTDKPSLQLTQISGKDPISQNVTVYILLEQTGRIRMSIAYNSTFASPILVRQLSDYFDLAVSTLLRDTHQYIHQIRLLTGRDQDRLRSWNGALPPIRAACVHEDIARRVQEDPDHPAVCGSDGNLTYRELDQLATWLSGTLRDSGVIRGQFIPICMDKTRHTPVVMLSVLKAGAIIVPLDPTQPASRLKDICDRVEATLILSSPAYRSLCDTLADDVLEVNDTAYHERTTGHSNVLEGESITVSPAQSAYVLFTSGTTGVPKGVMISHSSYCYAAQTHIQAFSLDASSRVLQISPYSFDVSMMEILTTLIAGATICTLTESEKSQMFMNGSCPFTVSHAFLTPSLARALDSDKAKWVDTLVLQGEPMTSSHISEWATTCRLINAYGPTECAVISTASVNLALGDNARCIGHGLGTCCWVVDQHDHNNLLPIGAVGELLLHSHAVGQGYLNQPQKTEEVFVDPPDWLQRFATGADNAPRIYKTGDLVRYDIQTGALLFEGRKDRQIRVEGHRIELADIEYHTMKSFPGANGVVVEQVTAPRSPSSGSSAVPWLVSCVLCEIGGDAEAASSPGDHCSQVIRQPSSDFHTTASAALRGLRETLPTHMIPALFVPMSRLPLSSSGKLDRTGLRNYIRKIPTTDWQAYFKVQQSKRQVSGETEVKLQKILTNLLGIGEEAVGADDNFFHLGGDSVLAMKVAASARAAGIAIRSQDILRHPTVSEWASFGNSKQEDPEHVRSYEPCSLITDAERQHVLSSYLDGQPPYTKDNVQDIFPTVDFQSFYLSNSSLVSMAEWFPSGLDKDRLYRACSQVMSHYSILRSMFVKVDERILQVVLRHVDPVFHFIECDDPEVYITQQSRQKTPATTGLGQVLVSFTVVTCKARTDWILIVRLSHAQYDGSSLPLLWQAIATAYEGNGLPKTTQFRDVVYNRLGDNHEKPFSFWQDYLRNAPKQSADPLAVTELPGPLPEDTIPLTIRREIKQLTRLPDVTVATLVKASLAWVLSKHAALPEIVLGQVVHGRGCPLPGMETVLGPCINFLPIRITIGEDYTIADLLHHVQAQQVATVPHDYLSLKHIIGKCTSWPDHAKLGCIVHHQGAPQTNGSIALGDVRSTSSTSWANSTPTPGQVGIISIERSSQSLDLYMTFPPNGVEKSVSEKLADDLADTIWLFSMFPDYSLGILTQEGVAVSQATASFQSRGLRN